LVFGNYTDRSQWNLSPDDILQRFGPDLKQALRRMEKPKLQVYVAASRQVNAKEWQIYTRAVAEDCTGGPAVFGGMEWSRFDDGWTLDVEHRHLSESPYGGSHADYRIVQWSKDWYGLLSRAGAPNPEGTVSYRLHSMSIPTGPVFVVRTGADD